MTELQVKRRLRFGSFDGYQKVMGKLSVYCMPMKKVMQLWFTRLPTIKDTTSLDAAVGGEDQPNEGYCEKTSASNKCLAGSAATLAVSDSEDDKLGPLTSCGGGGEKPDSDFGGDRRPKEPVSACALLHSLPNNSEDEEVCVVHRPVEENHECQIGGMVFSSTCCVVLVIFALLFVLVGSVLAFIVYHRVDVKLIKFLTNYNYLKVASPLMICLGLVMLIFGTVFWIAKRKRKSRSADYMNHSPAHLHPDSYFSPTDISPTPRSSTAARGRGSVCSGSSHLEWHCTSPILPRVSANWTPLSSESMNPEESLLNTDNNPVTNKWTLPPLPSYLCVSQNQSPVPLECETLLGHQQKMSKDPDVKKMPVIIDDDDQGGES